MLRRIRGKMSLKKQTKNDSFVNSIKSEERKIMTPKEYIKYYKDKNKDSKPETFIKAIYTPIDLKKDGYSLNEILKFGFDVEDLLDANYSKEQIFLDDKMKEKYIKYLKKTPIEKLKEYRISLQEMVEAGREYEDLLKDGYSKEEILSSDKNRIILADSYLKYLKNLSIDELKKKEEPLHDVILAKRSIEDILAAGYTFEDILELGYTIENIIETEMEDESVQIFIDFLKDYLPKHKEIDFYKILDNYVKNNDEEGEMNMMYYRNFFDYTSVQMKEAGFTCQDLKEAGFTYSELREAACTCGEVKELGATCLELKEAGFTYRELKNNGCGIIERMGIRINRINRTFKNNNNKSSSKTRKNRN